MPAVGFVAGEFSTVDLQTQLPGARLADRQIVLVIWLQ